MTLWDCRDMCRRNGIIASLCAALTFSTASGSLQAAQAAETTSLSIAPNSCALFIWSDENTWPRVVSTPNAAYSLYNGRAAKELLRVYTSSRDKFGQYARQDFNDRAGQLYQLHLGEALETEDAVFYKSGTWAFPNDAGWIQVASVKAASSCNRSSAETLIDFPPTTSKFRAPDWLKYPRDIEVNMTANEGINPVVAVPPPPSVMAETISAPAPVTTNVQILPSYSVQIGAFRDASRVSAHLEHVRNNAPFIDEYIYGIQAARTQDNAALYRLRITDLAERADAVQLCARFQASGIACFVPTFP